MDSVTEARTALINLLNDPELNLEFEDRELLTEALGALYDYHEFAAG